MGRFNILLVQHALGSLCPFVDRLCADGAKTEDIAIAPVSYSESSIVSAALSARGVSRVETSPASVSISPGAIDEGMERGVYRALLRQLKRCRKNEKPLMVVDDGGLVIRLLAGASKFGVIDDVAAWRELTRSVPIRIVEQTTRGITEAQLVGELPANVAIVDMATSEPKGLEASSIADNIVAGVVRELRNNAKGGIQGKKIAIAGFGKVGAALANVLTMLGATVVVYDQDEAVRRQAMDQGFAVATTMPDAVRDCKVVIGCSGHQSITRRDILAMKNGTVVISASSKTLEIESDHIRGTFDPFPPWPRHGEAPVTEDSVGSIHRTIQLCERNPDDSFHEVIVYLANCGCPINFTGEVNCVPPERIQLTEAVKYEAVKQAALTAVDGRMHTLERDRGQRVIDAMDRCEPAWRTSAAISR